MSILTSTLKYTGIAAGIIVILALSVMIALTLLKSVAPIETKKSTLTPQEVDEKSKSTTQDKPDKNVPTLKDADQRQKIDNAPSRKLTPLPVQGN